jgi:hypothetical protein
MFSVQALDYQTVYYRSLHRALAVQRLHVATADRLLRRELAGYF